MKNIDVIKGVLKMAEYGHGDSPLSILSSHSKR
jgi:hypothetical protein